MVLMCHAVMHIYFIISGPRRPLFPRSRQPGRWDPPPAPPAGRLASGPQALRPELRTAWESPAQVGATPLAKHPVQPLRGRSHFRFAKVTTLNQDLTADEATGSERDNWGAAWDRQTGWLVPSIFRQRAEPRSSA